MFYLKMHSTHLYGARYQRENPLLPLHGPLFSISSNGSFISAHTMAFIFGMAHIKLPLQLSKFLTVCSSLHVHQPFKRDFCSLKENLISTLAEIKFMWVCSSNFIATEIVNFNTSAQMKIKCAFKKKI